MITYIENLTLTFNDFWCILYNEKRILKKNIKKGVKSRWNLGKTGRFAAGGDQTLLSTISISDVFK